MTPASTSSPRVQRWPPTRPRLVVALACSFSACGPQVPDLDGDGTSSNEGSDATTAGASASAASIDGTAASTLGDPVCGDAVLDPGEACDDGNDIDADGCSHACEVSGTRTWALELGNAMPSLGVALEAHDGDAVVLVQHYDPQILPLAATVTRVDSAGGVVAAFSDGTAVADPDIARQPLAVASDGDALLGYPTTDGRTIARVELATGIEWSQALDGFAEGTVWLPDHVLMLFSDLGDGLYHLLDLPDDGGAPSMVEVPISADESLIQRRMFVHPGLLLIVTLTPDGSVKLYGGLPSVAPTPWSVDVIGAHEPGPLGAASNGTDLWVWTASERIHIDAIGHLDMEPEPRTTSSVLLALAAGGVITRDDQDVLFMTTDEREHWRGTTQGIPSFAAPDDEGGVYVLVTAGEGGNNAGSVWLERWVL